MRKLNYTLVIAIITMIVFIACNNVFDNEINFFSDGLPGSKDLNGTVETSLDFEDLHSVDHCLMESHNPYHGIEFSGTYINPGPPAAWAGLFHTTKTMYGYPRSGSVFLFSGVDGDYITFKTPITKLTVWVGEDYSRVRETLEFWFEAYFDDSLIDESAHITLLYSYQEVSMDFEGPVDKVVFRIENSDENQNGGFWFMDDMAFVAFNPDSTPPVIHSITLSPDEIWPPNGKMCEIIVTVDVTDNVDPEPEVVISEILVNDADATGDYQIDSNGRIWLKAARDAHGDDRVYTIVVTAIDAAGNETTSSAEVTVPHDQGNGKAKGR